jgi:hypothetical protein
MNDTISITARHLGKIRNRVREIQIRFDRYKEKLDAHAASVIQSSINETLKTIEENGAKIRLRANKLTRQRNKLVEKISKYE